MVRLTFCLLTAAGVLVGLSPLAVAAPAKSPEDRFSQMDKDGDKKLSLEEFVGKKTDDKKTKAEKRFKRLDKDSDDHLSFEEFKAGMKKTD